MYNWGRDDGAMVVLRLSGRNLGQLLISAVMIGEWRIWHVVVVVEMNVDNV